jgi:hypothetical protein
MSKAVKINCEHLGIAVKRTLCYLVPSFTFVFMLQWNPILTFFIVLFLSPFVMVLALYLSLQRDPDGMYDQ